MITKIKEKLSDMALKLMYITNKPEVAVIAQNAGVDRIFVDMEYIGKDSRQSGLDSVKNHHTFQDVRNIKKVLNKSELLVRVNPIHNATSDYCSSKEEIEETIEAGADIIMLPFFKTTDEVEYFINCVNGRCKTMLLLETPQAAENLDEILQLKGIDEIHIGINDLSLGYHKKFMFELVRNGTVEHLGNKIKNAGIPYGFGGIAALGKGMLPAEIIIKEHYRLGSSMAILSRSFLNTDKITDIDYIEHYFNTEVKKIREFELSLQNCNDFEENHELLKEKVSIITGN